MIQNLFHLTDYEPPMGDTSSTQYLSSTRAVWTRPLDTEPEAPAHRIIHAKTLQLHHPVPLRRIGVRPAQGYHKCGSRQDFDWVESFRVRIWRDTEWYTVLIIDPVAAEDKHHLHWYDLKGIEASAVMVEVRRCGIDKWWPSWNLASGAFILEGETEHSLVPRDEETLKLDRCSLEGCPESVRATRQDGHVLYETATFQVGFLLNRPGFSYLSLQDNNRDQQGANVLKTQPGTFFQGVHLAPVGRASVAAPTLRFQARGTTSVHANKVIYDLNFDSVGQHFRLEWTVHAHGLVLHASRKGEKPLRVWQSSLWSLGLQSTVSPAHALGRITREGQTGLMTCPVLLHLPGFGTFRVESQEPSVLWRSDADRPQMMTLDELKLGEAPQPEGDYVLTPGEHHATIRFSVHQPDIRVQPNTPDGVKAALKNSLLTSLTYRADTASLSNNGASMHCPISMDSWSAITTRYGELAPGLQAVDLLQTSLERWLDGGPGYASGPLLQSGDLHQAEDEYLMTGTAGLLGLAEYLTAYGTAEWVHRFRSAIQYQLDSMRHRDLDDDGLIESPYRTGTSKSGQWSTCWFDVISFGWKDAFANALLYRALDLLETALPKLDASDLVVGLCNWKDQLLKAYVPTFFNPETNWFAGWRCKEDQLHDYAFLPVNGAAVANGLVPPEQGRDIMTRLLSEMERIDCPDPIYGLPGNLWNIPDKDMADIMQGYPMGFYQNGGRTHAQSRHFLNGLYRVRLYRQADTILLRLCEGMARQLVFGGIHSGKDWRYWDDRPSGYEGLLTDQFGFLGVALERYSL